jgi:hypothetical protein
MLTIAYVSSQQQRRTDGQITRAQLLSGAPSRVETVYANFGSKGALLQQAIVGDDEQVPLSDRPEFRVLAAGDARARAQAAGRLVARTARRSAGADPPDRDIYR